MRDTITAHTEGAKDRLYPTVPSPKIALSLSLDAYLGSYTHLAYGTITLREHKDSSELSGAFPGRFNLDPFILEHITGEHFLVKVDLIPGVISMRTRARFEVDSRGKPARLGVEFEDGKPDIVIWFVLDENEVQERKESDEPAKKEKIRQ